MNDDLEQLLQSLKLRKIREILDRELSRAVKQGVAYEELLVKLLREELLDRQARYNQNRLKQAKIPEHWTIETFPFKLQPGVKQAAIRQLASAEFVPQATNIVFIGPTGVGKTGLATGLLMKALQNGHRGLFVKAQDLFDDMFASLADRSTRSLLRRLTNLDIILIDEMGYLNLQPQQSNIFFKLMEDRYGRKSTIITTNLDYNEWYSFLGNTKMVSALIDRLCHRCCTIRIEGPSLRKPSELS